MFRRALPLLAAAAVLGGCVSLEEAPMQRNAIGKDQRLLLLVFPAPGPLLSEDDSKAETAAKIVPGLGLVVKDMQDGRDLKASQDLQRYLPRWDAAGEFRSSFAKQLDALGQPAKIVGPQDAGIPADQVLRLNRAADVNDWQIRYYLPQPDHVVGRNYSTFLNLDDAVVLEVNLAYALDSDGEGNYTPAARAVTKLMRASTMHQLWRHEDRVDEKGATKTLYEFKVAPDQLIGAWKRLMPMLGAKVAESLRQNFTAAGVPLSPRLNVTPDVPVAADIPNGGGWAPAPIAAQPVPQPPPQYNTAPAPQAQPQGAPTPEPAPMPPGMSVTPGVDGQGVRVGPSTP